MTRRRTILLATALFAVALIAWLAATRGLYFYPTSVALGPCLPDLRHATAYSERESPMESVRFEAGDVQGLICYGRPSAKGRHIFGNRPDSLGRDPLVPDGALWRLGANEPTRLFINGPMRLGDIQLEAGRYALYARPDSAEWTLSVTRSTFHWGNDLTADVRAQDVGQILSPVYRTGSFVETFTISVSQAPGDIPYLVFEWADRQVLVPITS